MEDRIQKIIQTVTAGLILGMLAAVLFLMLLMPPQMRASRIALTLRKMYLDEARIYDNSDTFKLVAQIKNSKILEFKQTKWLKELNI